MPVADSEALSSGVELDGDYLAEGLLRFETLEVFEGESNYFIFAVYY